MDFSKTLNLPQTDFPMKADLPTREPLFQAFWRENDLYRKSLEKDAPKGLFLLHDGPPFSNGNIHLGHALNKTLKDLIPRFRTMQGYRAPYVPGWDNHGLPIEVEVMKEFRAKKEQWTPATLRARCRAFAGEWVETQKAQFQRLGIRADWEHPYLTMAPAFEAKIVETFAEMARKGYVYRGLKPVLWDTANETALANTEAEYKDRVSPSIYVRFPLKSDPNGVFGGDSSGALSERGNAYTIIWTTTPWTIPANLAVAVHPDADYSVVQVGGDKYLVAEPLRERVLAATGLSEQSSEVLKTVKGRELEGMVFRHPLPSFDRDSLLALADYVTMEDGTGVVHTAPGHGADDFLTGRKYNLPVLSPVNGRGRYTEEAGEFAGLTLDEANVQVPERLKEVGNLLAHTAFNHQYPHSPRAPHKPLIFRATVQWFVSVEHDDLRNRALAEIEDVEWFPATAKNRISAAVAGRPDWTISRQRFWGVGIPVFYANGEPVMTDETLTAVVNLVREKGTDAWYEVAPEDILPAGFAYNGVPASEMTKETDVLDVWFDSGTTSMAVLDSGVWENHRYPADVYLEGSDQHRGWFNSSLMLGTAVRGAAPFKQVITNGFTMDELGYKMSKSKGNVVDPLGVIEKYGADVLRLWVASCEYQEDTRLGDAILKQTADGYRRLRNTFRFLLGNLYDFDSSKDAVPVAELDLLDRWALSRLQKLVLTCTDAFHVYDFQKATQAILLFCGSDLSSFYMDVLKDRLYTLLPEDSKRRSSQTAMHEIASVLCRLLAPVLVHTCEEVWQELNVASAALARERAISAAETTKSVHLADWPEVRAELMDEAAENVFAAILKIRGEFNAQLSAVRAAGVLTKSQEAAPTFTLGAALYARLFGHEAALTEALIVPVVHLVEDGNTDGETVWVEIAPALGTKCQRSWFVREDVGTDAEYPTLSLPQAAIVRELVRRGAVELSPGDAA